jgi:hypothetical protein
MNFTLTDEQAAIISSAVTAVHRAAAATDSPDKAARNALTALGDGGFLDLSAEAGLLEAALVVEAVAREGVLAPLGARLLVAPEAGLDEPLLVGLMEGRHSLVRYGADCDAFIGLDGDEAFVATPDQAEITPIAESVDGSPLARVSVAAGTPLPATAAAAVRRRWRIVIAAEAAGAMQTSIAMTSTYVSERIAFGRPLGAFQAVQHRLARAQVHAEGATWLARLAAWHGDDNYLAAASATYACLAAAQVYEHTHQVTGAIGVTTEHGLVRHSRRLVALQRELGGLKAHARDVTAERLAYRGAGVSIGSVA